MALWIEECVLCSDRGDEISIHVYPHHILAFGTLCSSVHTQIVWKFQTVHLTR
jgi:hypothetical protein